MANLLTRKEFSALIGKSPQYVGSNIQRRKIIEENKRIDTDHPTNKKFIAKFTNLQVDEEKPKGKKKQSETDNTQLSLDLDVNTLSNSQVDTVKKKHEIVKIQAEVKLKKLELEKKKSKVLPIEFIIEWVSRNTKGTFSETVNFANTIIEIICNELDAPLEIKLKYKKQFKQGFNEVILESIKNQIPEALDYAKEYSLINKW